MSEVKTNKISSLASNNDITIDPDGTGDVVVASGHKLGVGTTSPAVETHIQTASGNPELRVESTGANYATMSVKNSSRHYSTQIRTDQSNAYVVRDETAGANRFLINTSGKVCIGGTSPSQKFVVTNAGADNIVMCENSSASIQMFMQAAGSGVTVGTLTNHQLQLLTNNTARMTIGDSGVVYIGGSTTRAKVNVERNDSSSYNYASISVSNQPDHFVFFSDSTQTGSITRSGGTGVNYNTSSDHRLKENAVDMTGAIARVKSLQPKRFNFIADDSVTVDGFMAHEAQTVVPEAVTGTKDEVDDDGNAVMQGIDQSKLVPLLTGALKEAIAKIETLETKVAALEAGS